MVKKNMFDLVHKCVPCMTPKTDEEDQTNTSSSTGTPTIRSRHSSSSRIGRSHTSVGESSTSRNANVAANQSTKSQPTYVNDFMSREIDRHYAGDLSYAVIQGNKVLEDFSQVEIGRKATFIGVYDGHGGAEAAKHVRENLSVELMRCVTENKTMSERELTQAFFATEEAWIAYVDQNFENQPLLAGHGTCCLVGVIWRKRLYIANAGDCRVIIGRLPEGSRDIAVEQLTIDDNVSRDPNIREAVRNLHQYDPQFIVNDSQGLPRIKGRIQISKAIGDLYLKIPKYNLDKHGPRYALNTPLRYGRPALSAEPSTRIIPIQPQDKFMVFASDGLWDLMSNEEVAAMVHEADRTESRQAIASRLIRRALSKVAEKRGGTYEEVRSTKLDNGERRAIHDDITVIVVFLNRALLKSSGKREDFPLMSLREGGLGAKSKITALDDLPE